MSQNDKAQLEDRDVPPSTESGKEVTMRTENTGQAKEPELDPEKVKSSSEDRKLERDRKRKVEQLRFMSDLYDAMSGRRKKPRFRSQDIADWPAAYEPRDKTSQN
ncbi:uncharacterized protein [Penaeus vannamei]|uniref:uncharacterized protein n=1 Tax=Penaeus vannamei TaxID=6689 RepID=UPI00387FA24D